MTAMSENVAKLVSIIGGGQLGRMLALAGYPLGLRFRFLDPSPAASASYVAEQVVGAYDDEAALTQLAAGAAVVTYEFENVPVVAARFLANQCPLYPPPAALEKAQDRLVEKSFFHELGIPTAPFAEVQSRAQFDAALRTLGLPAVLKTRRMGYDGKGQVVLHDEGDAERAWGTLGGNLLILERLIAFERELSILAVRGRGGDVAFYPLVENSHHEGILARSLAPAPRVSATLQAEAERYAARVLDALGYVGVLAIELFETSAGLLANEMAPRVHNSGHWTIEGAETSQFANHLRAILGLPLGATTPLGHFEMVNILGTLPDPGQVLATPGAHLHLYDKTPRPGRKLGHITFRRGETENL